MTYSAKEVRGLINRYPELKAAKDVSGYGLHLLCLLADLERAVGKMPPKEYLAVILCGFVGLSSREAGDRMGVSHMTAQARTEAGISWIVTYLNEGIE